MKRAVLALSENGLSASRLLQALGLALTSALIAWAFVAGRGAQTSASNAERAEIRREDEALCIDLGFELPEPKHARCLNGLADIRRKQMERWDAAVQ